MSDLPFEQWHPDAQRQCGFWWDLSPIACGQCARCRKEQRHHPVVQPPATPQEPDRVDVVAREIAKELMSNGFGDQGDRLAIRLGSQDFGGWSLDGAARQIRITLEQEGYVLDRMAEAARRAQLKVSAPPAVWQDIETAPTGTYVLAFWQRFGCYEVVKLDPAKGWIDEDDSDYVAPSHWMPLPSPPTPGGK